MLLLEQTDKKGGFIEMFTLLSVLPAPPGGTPAELAQDGIDFFSTWIGRIGGIVAIIGALKFALAIKDDNDDGKMQAVLIMVSGFMIQSAIYAGLLNIPATYTEAVATAEFRSILHFIGKWIHRVGALGFFVGALSFGFAVKDNNAVTKVTGLKTMAAGATAMALSAASVLTQFV